MPEPFTNRQWVPVWLFALQHALCAAGPRLGILCTFTPVTYSFAGRFSFPPMSTRSGSCVFKVNAPCVNWKSFDYAAKSTYMPGQEKEFIVKNQSTGWLCHRKLVIQVAPPQTHFDTDGYLIWADLLSPSCLNRGADNDWLWRRDEQGSLKEGEFDCNEGKTVGVGGQI